MQVVPRTPPQHAMSYERWAYCFMEGPEPGNGLVSQSVTVCCLDQQRVNGGVDFEKGGLNGGARRVRVCRRTGLFAWNSAIYTDGWAF